MCTRTFVFFVCSVLCAGSPGAAVGASTRASVAPTPPMGWNSWDAYGLTINEDEYKANATWQAQNLKRYGWLYSVIDEGWYTVDPLAKDGAFQFFMTEDGRYVPSTQRYPSATKGAGFAPLADYAHSLGLKFGIHIIRGIPKQAVARNLRIANSPYHAADAADTSDTCPWNTFNYGIKPGAAGQAYYDSLAKLYAKWGVDFLKVDCIAAHPYKPAEIQMISTALRKTGRPMVLSLSPGPAPLSGAEVLRQASQLWRISDDVWDHWSHDPAMGFSQSVSEQFAVAQAWHLYARDGTWPDADMLPIGFLGPRPGEGKPRVSKLTLDEQRTLLTGWAMFRSPLIIGANLTNMDENTKGLLTNTDVIAVDQFSVDQHEAVRDGTKVIWVSTAQAGHGMYVGVFNLGDKAERFDYAWQALGIKMKPSSVRDLWTKSDDGETSRLQVTLQAHASALYRVE